MQAFTESVVAARPPEGHATILAVNTLAPYMLTALLDRPERPPTVNT
jgi:hypothetical protein